MEIYIGGAYQGKLSYVKEKYPEAVIYDENTFEQIGDNKDEIVIWNRFHEAIRLLSKNMSLEEMQGLVEQIVGGHPDLIIISNEIGNGIVPVSAEERFYRESTGRILTSLASRADKVERIICKIPQTIK